ncbi:hypothetical protein GWP57_09390 [Gammaproteobacteria bacterium]|nr:hypothetical protein [Gammaproteobacteria bacterium]
MSSESTVTEQDPDANAQQLAQGQSADHLDFDPDLNVDGMSHSPLSRFLGLFGFGK